MKLLRSKKVARLIFFDTLRKQTKLETGATRKTQKTKTKCPQIYNNNNNNNNLSNTHNCKARIHYFHNLHIGPKPVIHIVNLMFGCDFRKASSSATSIAVLFSKSTPDRPTISEIVFEKVVRPTGPIPMSARTSV